MTSTTQKNHTTEQNQQSMENSMDDRLDSSCKSSQSWGRSRIRPGFQDGTPAFSNQRAANRMVRPRRFIYTREEKLSAIRYCREARSLNVETSRCHPITMEVAARKLFLNEVMLRRWMKEEDKLAAMSPGSKRADKRLRVQAKTLAAPQEGTRETVSGDEASFVDGSSGTNHQFSYYLQLSPRQLRDTLSLTASDHRLIHVSSSSILYNTLFPLLALKGGECRKLYTFQDAYNFLDCQDILPHPGHPLPPPAMPGLPSNERPSLIIHAESTYTRRASESKGSTLRVVDVNKHLYELAPEFDIRAPSGYYTGSYASVRPCYDEVKHCVALICQSITTLSSKVTSALPVRIELDYDCPYPGAPAQWAVLLSFGDEELLLPLALSLWGPQTMNASRPNILYLQGWTTDHGIRKSPRESKVKVYYSNIERLLEVFKHSTVLHVMDVEPLFLRAEGRWRPRRYTSTWTLYTTPIHANYACSRFDSPIQGRFMNIELLVNNIRRWGSRVVFKKDTTRKPFQLLRLRDFTLHRPTPQPCDHLYSLTEKLVEGVRPQGLKEPYSDEVEDLTTTKMVKYGEGMPTTSYTMWEPGRGIDVAHDVTDSIAEPEDFADVTDAEEADEATQHGNRGHMKKRRLNQRSSMQRAVLKNYSLELYSGYCKHHSSRITQYVSSLKAMGAEPPMPQWELKLADDAMTDVKALWTSYHRCPHNTWVIDFEYITLGREMSPIPLQFAIRQLDGKLLLAENVHYGLSLENFLAKLNNWEITDRRVQLLFTRCYGDIMTNGLRPDEIRDEIVHKLNYSAERISIISWYGQQDMQCFQRLLSGSRELIVPKESHHLCSNFQNIDVGRLLKKLLPRAWPSLSLSVVHRSLLARHRRSGDKGEYHTAAYDTEAVTDIVKEITTLIE
ncbi:hypothetical protein BDV36DRAFT_309726 [Aspergillus pseudocaelatus]|uniref:Uncharacterized protein n=1 Tax=Aspergillus pseudocaelatus TaxID=1825620 RepID=A0ABQ6WLB4_9EURO|nr:hypothetical protein BDV36DRAFT_309726 [Aspergillus pseudocaelatus]